MLQGSTGRPSSSMIFGSQVSSHMCEGSKIDSLGHDVCSSHPYLLRSSRAIEDVLYVISLTMWLKISLDICMDPLCIVLIFRYALLLYMQSDVVHRVVEVVLKVL